ncbi:MAG: L,D-transpeptidase family protein, partial [Defluviitoga tunisiensis]
TGDVYSFLVSSTDKDGQYISHFFNNFLAKEDFVPEIKVEITTSIGPNGYEYYLDFYPNNTLYLIDIIIDGKEFDSKEDFLNALKNLKEGLYRTQFIFRNRYGIYFKVDSTFLKLSEVVITENILKPQQKFEIIGYHIVQKGESLYKIAREYNVLPGDLVNINNLRDPSLIYPGQALKIGKVEYYESPIHLEIDLSKNKMYLYFHEQLLKTYVVAVGMSDYTPPGYYRISYKEKDPALYWYDEYIPPGSLLNGMGTRWLQLSNPQYGIHGTTKPWEIGKRISHGCIRMFNFDVEEIDFITSLGTEVYVYNSKN